MTDSVVGLILAGGLARRMGGGDKAMLRVGGRPILARVVAGLRPQCTSIVLNANGDPARFAEFGLPVIADTVEGFVGPLAGILAGLEWMAVHRPDAKTLLSVPADCPFLPSDLLTRLDTARCKEGVPLACAGSGGWRHPVVALWPVALRDDLREALKNGQRKIETWMARHGAAVATWPDRPFDPFFNVNTPEDVVEADRVAATHAL